MKAPETITIAFDPFEAGIVSFTSKTAKIIWCCIRKQHIVDQHFDAQVFGFAEYLDENMPIDYKQFKEMIYRTELCKFGINHVGTDFQIRMCTNRQLDDEFWQGVWEYISGEKELEIIMPEEVKQEFE